ncbi:hypothetical protein HDV00_007225 [Rhizophlyctis rosea]|nr:hypothetical protein HDV00_007225 [Rhizophlyctis rosea]
MCGTAFNSQSATPLSSTPTSPTILSPTQPPSQTDSPTPTPTPTTSAIGQDESKTNTTAVAGGTAGGATVVGIIGFVGIFRWRKARDLRRARMRMRGSGGGGGGGEAIDLPVYQRMDTVREQREMEVQRPAEFDVWRRNDERRR